MSKSRLLLAPLLVIALALPATTLAQGDAPASDAPTQAAEAEDTRIADLRAAVPEDFAGLPLRETAQLATGEQLAGQMAQEERSAFEAMLETSGKTFGDYVAANTVVPLNDTDALVIQAHRVVGLDAEVTLDTWVQILSLNARRPRVTDESIGGQSVSRVTDEALPGLPPVRLYAAGDIVWMVQVSDEAIAAEAVRTLSKVSRANEAE